MNNQINTYIDIQIEIKLDRQTHKNVEDWVDRNIGQIERQKYR